MKRAIAAAFALTLVSASGAAFAQTQLAPQPVINSNAYSAPMHEYAHDQARAVRMNQRASQIIRREDNGGY